MQVVRPRATVRRVTPSSYAMFWSIGDGPRRVGRVELGVDSLSLSATSLGAGNERIRFRDLARVLLEGGVLYVERRAAPPVLIGSLDMPGALRELAERVSSALR
jgi:hypothetical protein